MTEPDVPRRINRLNELANNLWWSWQPQARELFRSLNYQLWRLSGHNPVKQLQEISFDRLAAAAGDPSFLALYDSVMSTFDLYLSGKSTWFRTTYPNWRDQLIAYFSAEFAIHNSLPIYAGGLGVLAGDTCKEASDLGLPLAGVGFMYPQGYFHQRISADGWQEDIYRTLDFNEAPINPCPWPQGCGPLVEIQLDNRTVHIWTWQVRLGRVNLYLLDTNIEQNSPQDRKLSARLYTADREQRIQQEIVLGIGGVRVLRTLGLKPSIWCANEGHTAFMMLERIREEVEKGASFGEAIQKVQATTVFTTHTPVPAGHDVFPIELVEKYFRYYWDSLGIERQTFMGLGQYGSLQGREFNMTAFALRMARQRNGVSELHGAISRKMWQALWPGVAKSDVPISHITNGVHVPTWIAREIRELYDEYLDPGWFENHDDPAIWQRVFDIPDEELWSVHQVLKRKLSGAILERAQERWAGCAAAPQQALAMGGLLDPEVLTIAFVRRFAEYKRPILILHDIDRLKRLVTDRWHPVQIIFAGKSHPDDFASKRLLQQVYTLLTNCEFRGRVAFIEDYDMHMARYLVQGVDVWLNTPRRLQEACGTSGMKASINGVIHLSVPDGWWHEGYNGANGWVIGDSKLIPDPMEEDKADAESLYRLLENDIVPMYYDRDRKGVPHRWVQVTKEAIRSVTPVFSARRMLKEYARRVYLDSGVIPRMLRGNKSAYTADKKLNKQEINPGKGE